ncbi:MAG: hypothetical protein AAF658_13930, partial [Myxococcota bacterium]
MPREKTPPPGNLKRGALVASILMLGTVAMASSAGHWGSDDGTAVAKAPPKPVRGQSGTVTL